MKTNNRVVQAGTLSPKETLRGILIIAFLFFMFGFVSWINAILIPYFRIGFSLTHFNSYLVAFAFYISYLFFSLPSSYLLQKIGFKKGMMFGFWAMALGAFIFIPAAILMAYPLFLVGLFTIGAGLAMLQTAANPYVTILGPIESGAKRMSIMGIFNKGAGILAPLVFAAVIFRESDHQLFREIETMSESMKLIAQQELIGRVIGPYTGVGIALVVLGILIRLSPLPEIDTEHETAEVARTNSDKTSILQFPYLILGALAWFLHVGTQVVAIDTIISYAGTMGISVIDAKALPSYTLLAAIIGYLIGVATIPRLISQRTALIICALLGVFFTLMIIYARGSVNLLWLTADRSIWFVVLLGLANSLVGPAIWPLAIRGLGRFTKIGSSVIVMGLSGNAVLPILYGMLADRWDERYAYWVLMPCYLYILFYALRGFKITSWSWARKPAAAAVLLMALPLSGSCLGNGEDALEPYTYREDFEDRVLGAWASYPLWQDIAYNQNFRVNELVPGDPNISLVQKVTPYSVSDNYAGAQKLIDIYLVPGASLQFRYYLKSSVASQWLKVRFAAGALGQLDVTAPNPSLNGWQTITVTYDDVVRSNGHLKGSGPIRIYALAIFAKFASADPDMPVYLGLDDIVLAGARETAFRFAQPEVYKLPEFRQFIPHRHYQPGDLFTISGTWALRTDPVQLVITPLTDLSKTVYEGHLEQKGGAWNAAFPLTFPEGLYQARLTAHRDNRKIAETLFTISIVSGKTGGQHPRLLYDAAGQADLKTRLSTDKKYASVFDNIRVQAEKLRAEIPIESLVYDLDQFPDENWLPTWSAWGSRIYHTGEALRLNARAYAFHGDKAAADYVKKVLLRLASWPDWTHPWQTKRGRFSEHRTGGWSHRLAEAYDLVYDALNHEERYTIRQAIKRNIIEGVHKTYVVDDNITAGTSNWIAMTVGGALMNMAAIFRDGEDTEELEPYFTGAVLKLQKFTQNVTDNTDGAWGEGFSYNNYSFENLSYSLPSLENVFNIDLSAPLRNTFREYIWAGWIKEKRWFEHGDSGAELASANNWAYILGKYRDPMLSWFYHWLKPTDTARQPVLTFEDALFLTSDIPQSSPFTLNPNKLFRQKGTVVFKGGWDTDDLTFVMRSGPFYNHQHIDQGSFWLADKGRIFIRERPLANTDYYDDPIYESWFTQPVGHSTILIDGNPQSQRTGDPPHFAQGFDDHASITHFLDGRFAAFATGDIGKLYWGKVKKMTRNALFLKPGTLLMIDIAEPGDKDVSVDLLYQVQKLAGIIPSSSTSAIVGSKDTLHIAHLTLPGSVVAKETPHYLHTLRNVHPLEKEGMLVVSAKTNGRPLVLANLFSTAAGTNRKGILTDSTAGFLAGETGGHRFVISKRPGDTYTWNGYDSDAIALALARDRTVLAAQATFFSTSGIELRSDQPITVEWAPFERKLKYYVDENTELRLHLERPGSALRVNGKLMKSSRQKKGAAPTLLSLPKGEGTVEIL